MKDDLDILRQRRQLYIQGNMLVRRFHMCSVDVKTKLFRTYCTPLYTAHLWWNFTKANMRKLYVAYNNVYRMMHRLPPWCSASQMFVGDRVPNCQAVIRNLVFRFITRLDKSYNTIVRDILSSDSKWLSRIRKTWMKMLYVHYNYG